MGKAQNNTSILLTRTQLSKLKFKAIRSGVWFKALPRIDRVLVDLTIKVVENIRSSHLTKSLFVVVGKLEDLLASKFTKIARTFGRSLAEKVSAIAQKWGNVSAKCWATDGPFVVYLAVIHANTGFRGNLLKI